MKIIELFAGIGACSKALTNLGIEHEIVDAVEIDKYAIKSFNAVHGTNFEPQDIKEWDKNIECDLIMHGSPCQDFSVAGLGKGGDKDSGTRSSLMYETLRIVEKLKPKYVIWENVKNLLSAKHRHNFDAYLEAMEKLGYENHYQVLNAKDYGIPQNRERVFTVSILGGGDFEFPEPIPLEKKLKDMLEDNVDKKYYLSDEAVAKMHTSTFNSQRVRNYKDPQSVRVVGRLDIKGHDYLKRVYDKDGISPTLTTMGGGNTEPKIIDDYNGNIRKDQETIGTLTTNCRVSAPRNGWKIAEPFCVASRGRGENNEQHLEPRKDGNTNTITSVQKDNYIATPYRIRKLTEVECWKLMGFEKSDCEKARASGISKTQLYKQAGNSIVVKVLEAILKELLNA